MHVTKIVFKLISEQKQLSHCFHIVFFKSHTFVKMNDKKKEFLTQIHIQVIQYQL